MALYFDHVIQNTESFIITLILMSL